MSKSKTKAKVGAMSTADHKKPAADPKPVAPKTPAPTPEPDPNAPLNPQPTQADRDRQRPPDQA
jgi:hypothetical protein